MFTPRDLDLERGWPGRIDGEEVVQLAAQTLQSFFSGGGTAREHARYRLDEVRLLAPVLHPPAVRLFDESGAFAFANPAAVVGTETAIAAPEGAGRLAVELRMAAVLGGDGEIGGVTVMAAWVAPGLPPAKDRDFAIGLGPVVVTPDELPAAARAAIAVNGSESVSGGARTDLGALVAVAARNTSLFPGDVVAAAPAVRVDGIEHGDAVRLDVGGIGTLRGEIAG
jgi:2-keto-4-pentenoate hydratase/2-oxohepta-3-ene-1,7-dioic acid hydratase in catechol pathway